MNRAISWFIRNPVAAHVLVIVVVVLGLLAFKDIKKSLLPHLTFDWLTISIHYPGASPSEVEQAAVAPIETAIASTPGVASIESTASESSAYIKIAIDTDSNAQALKDTLQSQIDSVSLPALVDHPQVALVSIKVEPVATIAVHGPYADRKTLNAVAEKIKQDLLNYPEITRVVVVNQPSRQIHIEASAYTLQKYGMTFSELENAINRQSISTPAGTINTDTGSLAIRTSGEAQDLEDLKKIVVRSLPDGSRLFLGDVANIYENKQQTGNISDFNGEPAAYINVLRTGNQDLLSLSKIVRNYIKHPATALPQGLKLDLTQDVSYYFRSRMNLLLGNGVSGLILIFATLFFFLGARLSFWATADIPFSFLGTVWVLHLLGGSFDMVSLFAFILVLGIIGDDSIVIAENIFKYRRSGLSATDSAVLAAQEMASPVVYSSLATIMMFAPLLFLPGVSGKLIQTIPIVVISVLTFSLFEALFVLPSHLSHMPISLKKNKSFIDRIVHVTNEATDYFIMNIYRPVLEKALQWRYVVITFFVMLFLISIALVSSGWQKTRLSIGIEADTVQASVAFPFGASKNVMYAQVKRLEQAAVQVQKDLLRETGKAQIQNIITHYGEGLLSQDQPSGEIAGSVVMEMTHSEHRTLTGDEIVKHWRQALGVVPSKGIVEFDSSLNKPGPAVDIRLTSPDLKELYHASEDLKKILSNYPGVYGVTDSFQLGHQEIRVRLKPIAEDLGIKTSEVAQQVRQVFYGVELHSLHEGQETIQVTLNTPEEERKSLWYLQTMLIKLPSGASTSLQTIADIDFESGPGLITRSNQKRAVRVNAFVDEQTTHSADVMRNVRKQFLDTLDAHYANVKWEEAGEPAADKIFQKTLWRNTFIALLAMYLMMVISFKSFSHGLIVMTAVPFGFVGASLGHMIFGQDLTIWSLIGITTVFGIVVNHNVVLVDYVQRQQEEGADVQTALRGAGVIRFKPIILTTLTTVVGLIPLIFDHSVQSSFLVPMAISLSCGVLFATLISLLFVPCLYYFLADLQHLKHRYFGKSVVH